MSSSEGRINKVPPARWLRRFSVLAVCLVWPLIWVGGLVTTYDAGMAVPDWPNTYGYNLFLYPYKTWLFGPFDLFIEHGHRLLGAVVGMVAIAIVGLAYFTESRRWVFWLAIGLLLAVIVQGALGGMRVVLGDRTLAMVHGCVGPAFFALCFVMAEVTSRKWWSAAGGQESNAVYFRSGTAQAVRLNRDQRRNLPEGSRPTANKSPSDGPKVGGIDPAPARSHAPRGNEDLCPAEGEVGDLRPARGTILVAVLLVAVSYVQLILGAQLRHAQPDTPPGRFTMTVALHLMTALLLWVLAVAAWRIIRRCGDLTLSRPAVVLVGLVGIQILLGVGTWVVSYGWPAFLSGFLSGLPGASGFLLRSKGFADSITVTAHVATGALILGVATLGLVRLMRVRWCRMHEKIPTS